MNETQQQIVKAYTDGNFLPFVYEQQNSSNTFGNILPNINADVQDVMDCLNTLVSEAKGDTAATRILSSLNDFCSSDEKRSDEMLNIAVSEPEKYYLFISRAIIANPNHDEEKCFDKIIPLLSHKNKVVRSAAILSLGEIKYNKEAIFRQKALEKLAEITRSEKDDQVLGNIFGSICNFIIDNASLLKKGTEVLAEVMSKGSEFTTHIVSEKFAVYADILSDDMCHGVL